MDSKGEGSCLLAGMRVLDLADEKASFCTKLLGDMGACVIKVEKPGGDPSRGIGPFWENSPKPERSLFFHYHNANKYSVTINLEHGRGRDLLRRLIKSSDIMVESFPPGYLKQLGLGFEVLRKINPRLIQVSVTGFGQTGPRNNYKSCDLVASAFGGQMYVSGSHATPPLKPFGEQSHYTASLFAAIGILLALRKRAQSGRGEQIDISIQEAVASTVEHIVVRYFYDQIISQRQGSQHWNNSFCILPCKDGHILVTLFHQWETLVEWMASEGMAGDLGDEKWKDEGYRLKHRDHVISILQRWTKTHTSEELFEVSQLMRFPWAPVHSVRDVLDSHQLKDREFFFDVNYPETGTIIKYPRLPYKSIRSLLKRWKRAPLIGEDNVKIYREELGLSDRELRRLASMNVI